MISRRFVYAVKAMVYLGRQPEGRLVHVGEIGRAENIPVPFLQAILTRLWHASLVQSRKGRTGGYRLARSAERITLEQIRHAVDGPVALTPCLDASGERCPWCPEVEGECGVRAVLGQVQRRTVGTLSEATVRDLMAAGARHDVPR